MSGLQVENPMRAADRPSGEDDLEASIERGTLVPEQAIRTLQKQLQAQEQSMSQIREALEQLQGQSPGDGAGRAEEPIVAAIRNTVAHLNETPSNFHQCTLYFLTTDAPEDAKGKAIAPLLFVCSATIVLGQCATVTAIGKGTSVPTCASNDHCNPGFFCGTDNPIATNRCGSCGWDGLFDVHTRPQDFTNVSIVAEACAFPHTAWTSPHPKAYGWGILTYPATTVTQWCEACVYNDGTANPMSTSEWFDDNIAAMGIFELISYAMSVFVVALTVVGEV
jgi:hypothetical protein